jgi:hypothetical protein
MRQMSLQEASQNQVWLQVMADALNWELSVPFGVKPLL